MKINLNNYLPFAPSVKQLFFSKKDKNVIMKMSGSVDVISTVCPDYPNDGNRYTFNGQLGIGISLTARHHLDVVPDFIDELKNNGLSVNWIIIIADMPELVDSQREFYERVAGSKDEYLLRCNISAKRVQDFVGNYAQAMTFRDFYEGIDYAGFQSDVALRILEESMCQPFCSKFNSFLKSRIQLAELFRGRKLNDEERRVAAAHGMSLYVSHGTLIRKKYQYKNVIVVNHATTNLQNFFLAKLVRNHEHLDNRRKFPIGFLDVENY